MVRRILTIGAVAAATTLGAMAGAPAHASTSISPCPVHTLVGHDAGGYYVWPPGCGPRYYLPGVAVQLPPKPGERIDCDGAVVTLGGTNYDVDFLPCPGPAI
jgi:hypothetical protein